MPIFDSDISRQLQSDVKQALATNSPLIIKAGGSKDFYGRTTTGSELNISAHQGIINYHPSELVITARAGTPLKCIEQLLSENQQMLAFEPPAFADSATLGGTIACNLSGPRRAYSGAARDYVLGTKIINGKAEILSFGGEVMKNVAGYDVSRLMTGALGTLGVLLEVSLKVVPIPDAEITLVHSIHLSDALAKLQQWTTLPLPISASCFYQDQLYIRLSGAEPAIRAAQQSIGGDPLKQGNAFWHSIKEQRHHFFDTNKPLSRLSLAANTQALSLGGDTLYEWGGALRWLVSDTPLENIQSASQANAGHACLFRCTATRDTVFQPLAKPLLQRHRQLKQAFDPQGIFNIGRLYPEF